jgi:phospholipid/cholesterol/gamma-HCH transport system substrate-binding protein
VDRIAGDVESVTESERGDVQASIKNVREITESIKTLVGTSQGEVSQTGEAVRSSLDKLQATVDNLDKSLRNVETITGRMEKGEGTVGHILTDDTIAKNIENITDDAGGFIRSITKLQTIVGLRTEYNFLSGQPKEYLAVQLVPSPDKFYLIEIVNDPRGLREDSTTFTETMDKTTASRTTTYSLNKLKYTLMFGKTYAGLITGRFGIKESTGGFGLDLHLANDRLLLSVDLFDTLFNTYPRLQARATVAVLGHSLYVVGGVDDILNSRAKSITGGGLDFFLGGQLVFNDEDLKSLLLFGGSAASGASK